MCRALFHKWKQPVFYNYDTPLRKHIVLEVVENLYDAGYIVIAVTCDQESSNSSVWKRLNVGIEENQKCYLAHPKDENLKVFVFADPPHLLKNLRNNLFDNGFTLDNKVIDKRYLERLLALNKNELKITYKLEQKHIDVQGNESQNVGYAAAVFSNNTSESVRWCGMNGFYYDESGMYND